MLYSHIYIGLRLAALLKKEILAQVFSCQFCEIFKNSFFYRAASVAAFDAYLFVPAAEAAISQKSSMCSFQNLGGYYTGLKLQDNE